MTTSPLSVLGICGSLRKGSYNRMLLETAKKNLPPAMSLDIYELHNIPFFNQDVEAEGLPASVVEFRDRIEKADALLIATPEYNHAVPGVLKNALDWASRPPKPPLFGKPAALMGASQSQFGTARAQLNLRLICATCNVLLLNKPELLVMQAQNKFDAGGNLTDATTEKIVKDLLAALGDWTRRLQGK